MKEEMKPFFFSSGVEGKKDLLDVSLGLEQMIDRIPDFKLGESSFRGVSLCCCGLRKKEVVGLLGEILPEIHSSRGCLALHDNVTNL